LELPVGTIRYFCAIEWKSHYDKHKFPYDFPIESAYFKGGYFLSSSYIYLFNFYLFAAHFKGMSGAKFVFEFDCFSGASAAPSFTVAKVRGATVLDELPPNGNLITKQMYDEAET
jgi:hypothetical protein